MFFDTECANCFNGAGKICSFGYVLTDTDFNVIEKADIVMNPAAPFDVKGFKIRGLKLAYPFSHFEKQKKFPAFYERIRALLTKKGRLVVGHNTRSDASYLFSDTERYRLPPINFEYIDTQELVKSRYDRSTKLSLDELYAELCGSLENIHVHSSEDDAYMTMALARYVAGDSARPFHEEAVRHSDACGGVFLGRIITGESVFGVREDNRTKGKNQKLLDGYIKGAVIKGKPKITIPKLYEEENFRESLMIAHKIKENGLGYARVLTPGGIFVTAGEGEEDVRLGACRFRKKIRIITFPELYEMLKMTAKDIHPSVKTCDDIIGTLPENIEWYSAYKRWGSRGNNNKPKRKR